MVQQPPARAQRGSEPPRVEVDVDAADMLDHADRGDRVEVTQLDDVAVVGDADVELVGKPFGGAPLPRDGGLRP